MSIVTHFTADWFTQYADNWLAKLGHLKDRPSWGLEIGSYEGRSAAWLLENILTHPESSLTCVDCWDGSDKTLDSAGRAEQWFDLNMRNWPRKVIKVKARSVHALNALLQLGDGRFDFVFIDGSHEGYDALLDLLMAWPLVKPGGWLAFDDYKWEHQALRSQPKDAWDAFVSVKPEGMMSYQLEGRLMFVKKGGA